MIKVGFEGTGKTVDIPEAWDEFPSGHVAAMFQDLERVARGALTMEQLLLLEVRRLLGLKRFTAKALSEKAVANLAGLVDLISFVMADGGNGLSFDSVRNPLPLLKVRGTRLLGPGDACMDLTFGEYRNAAQAANTYFRTGNQADLDECVAHLYRPAARTANKAGRRIRPATQDTFPFDVNRVASAPEWQKRLILCWFCNCIGHLQTGIITVGGEEIDMAKIYSGSGESKGPENTLNDLLIQVAKEGSIGDVDAVDESPLPLILLHMWSTYKENKRYELQIQKTGGA